MFPEKKWYPQIIPWVFHYFHHPFWGTPIFGFCDCYGPWLPDAFPESIARHCPPKKTFWNLQRDDFLRRDSPLPGCFYKGLQLCEIYRCRARININPVHPVFLCFLNIQPNYNANKIFGFDEG